MRQNDIAKELESLRNGLESLGDRFLRVRYEDFKADFNREINRILGEESQKFFEAEMCKLDVDSSCSRKSACVQRLRQTIEDTVSALNRDELDSALKMLDDTETFIAGRESPCLDSKCSSLALEILRRIRALLHISGNLRSRLASGEPARSEGIEPSGATLPPEETERLLSPLASARRLGILSLLSLKERSFSEISDALGLKTGHLQFHLRTLREGSYVRVDRRSRLYSITPRGMIALSRLNDLVSQMRENEGAVEPE